MSIIEVITTAFRALMSTHEEPTKVIAEEVLDPREFTVEDVHLTLDCDGTSDDDISRAHMTKPEGEFVDELQSRYGFTRDVARDMTQHYFYGDNDLHNLSPVEAASYMYEEYYRHYLSDVGWFLK